MVKLILSGVPICLIIFVSSTITIQIMLRRNKSGFKEKCEEYIKREEMAENTIKKMPSDLPYIYPDKNILPVKEYPDKAEFKKILKKQKACIRKSELEMIYFEENYSNTDLKLKYGKNNLDKITCLEEHYNGYIYSLLDWAKELIALDNIQDARIVLEEAIRMNSDISQTYILLSDIYSDNKKLLSELKQKAQKNKLRLKDKTIEYIDSKIECI